MAIVIVVLGIAITIVSALCVTSVFPDAPPWAVVLFGLVAFVAIVVGAPLLALLSRRETEDKENGAE